MDVAIHINKIISERKALLQIRIYRQALNGREKGEKKIIQETLSFSATLLFTAPRKTNRLSFLENKNKSQ